MELKQFIKTAISDITNAVSELQSELQNGTVLNPTLSHLQSENYEEYIKISRNRISPIQNVDFEIEVAVSDDSKKGAEAKITVTSFSLKGGMAKKNLNQTSSRISFTIPVLFPWQDPPRTM